jgi:GDP-L-fucose synthase
MKKILLTGSEGFVGQHLSEYFSQQSEVQLFTPGQHDIDLTNSQAVAEYVTRCQPDIIIHSATSNTQGKGYENDVCEQNLRMFFNLYRYKSDQCVMYTLCSGSSYDRAHWVENMSEDYLGEHIPEDGQGFSKFVIASHARHLDNVVTLRLFGIFGSHEDHRYKFISNTIAKRVLGMDVTLIRNAIYDYLDVDDFCNIMHQLIEQKVHTGEFNVTPDESVSLVEIIQAVDSALGQAHPFNVVNSGLGTPYTGNNQKLHAVLPELTFTPIATSINRLVDYYQQNSQLIDRAALEQDQLMQHAKRINQS